MLKKNNKILIGNLVFLLVLSVGYALFSDTITINGTATAKGKFDMTATCQPGISSKLGTVESLGLVAEGGYENDTCSVVDDAVSTSVNFKYPGAIRYFTVKIKNTGTIDAVINLKEVRNSTASCSSPDLTEEEPDRCYVKEQISGDSGFGTGTPDGHSFIQYYHLLAISDENDNILSNEEAVAYYDVVNKVVTLPVNYSGYLVLDYRIHSNNESGMLNALLRSTFEFPFEQAPIQ